jgi:hypothetical protein
MTSRCQYAFVGSMGMWSLIFALAVWTAAAPALAASPTAAALKQGAARCLARQGLDACDDAIRWNPGDPALLVALADLELRAKRPGDALRHYRRAAEMAPAMNGLNAKIAAAEAQLHPKHVATAARPASKPITAQAHQYSNAAPITESH